MNGFSEKIMNNPSKVETVELVLEELDKMNIISYFKNLKILTLINVNIYQIEVNNYNSFESKLNSKKKFHYN